MEYIPILTALVSGGAISAFVSYFAAARSAKREDFSLIIEQWKADNSRLRLEIDEMTASHTKEKREMTEEITRLRIEVAELRGQVAVLGGKQVNG